MSKVWKYDIRWQKARVEVKDIKNFEDKLKFIKDFVDSNTSKNNIERALNWGDGLIIAYKSSVSADAYKTMSKQLDEFKRDVSALIHKNKNISEDMLIDNEEINASNIDSYIKIFKDLLKRNKKWTDSGYLNNDLVTFMGKLIDRILDVKHDDKTLNLSIEFEKQIEKGTNIFDEKGSSHKFLY